MPGYSEGGFKDCTKLESVKLPENIAGISPYSFKNCKSLKLVEINSVKKDGKDEPKFQYASKSAFYGIPPDARFVIKVRESNATLKQKMSEFIKEKLIEAKIKESQITIE